MQLDAAEKLLRLELRGAAARDVPRVVLHCCLQEQAWNPFYAKVMARVAMAGKLHRTAVQQMVLEKARNAEELNARQVLSLSRFVASLLADQVRPVHLCTRWTGLE